MDFQYLKAYYFVLMSNQRFLNLEKYFLKDVLIQAHESFRQTCFYNINFKSRWLDWLADCPYGEVLNFIQVLEFPENNYHAMIFNYIKYYDIEDWLSLHNIWVSKQRFHKEWELEYKFRGHYVKSVFVTQTKISDINAFAFTEINKGIKTEAGVPLLL